MSTQPTPGQPGWFPDPASRFDTRYWDGSTWTRAVMRGGTVDTDTASVPSTTGRAALPGQAAATQGATAYNTIAPPAPTDRLTSLPPQEAQARVSQMLAMGGITVQQSVAGRLDGTVEVKGEPNWIVAFILLCFWIVPGIVYWYIKSKPTTHRLTLLFVEVKTGTRISIQASPPVLERLAPVLTQLPW